MSGAELGGRLIGLEAIVLALATQVLLGESEDKVQAIFAGVKGMSQALLDGLVPDAGPVSPIVKEMEKHAAAYVEQHIDTISRQRARLLRQAAGK
jgi:hypothetical protein